MITKNFWTEERQQILVTLWKEGKSAREIAETLGEGITRNAVIGKANRMGLSQQQKKGQTTPTEPDKVLMPSAKQCQWPFGDPGEADFHFCGRPIQPGWPYCLEHCSLAYRSLNDKEEETEELNSADALAQTAAAANTASAKAKKNDAKKSS